MNIPPGYEVERTYLDFSKLSPERQGEIMKCVDGEMVVLRADDVLMVLKQAPKSGVERGAYATV